MRVFRLLACCCVPLSALFAQHVNYLPNVDRPYSAAATIAPEAVKVFTGTYTAAGQTLEAQANAAFAQLAADLKSAGASLEDVVNVRGYLRIEPGDSQMEAVMGEWNRAFAKHFGGRAVPPTRTTVGVTTLEVGTAKVAFDAVVALPASAWPLKGTPRLANSRIVDVSPRLSAVQPFSSLVLTSGVLADSPPAGTVPQMAAQTTAALGQLVNSMAKWEASPRDVVFVRALLSPALPPEGEAAPPVDVAGFQEAWKAFWAARRMTPPPVSVSAAPGFNNSGRVVEIEFYAALPGAGGFSSTIERDGAETAILSRSTRIGREAALTWFSGVVDTTRADHHGQGTSALLTLTEKMAAAKVKPENIVQLRAYLEIINGFGPDFAAWNQAYGRFFNHPKLNDIRPVRTAFPVLATPGASLLEIELIGVSSAME